MKAEICFLVVNQVEMYSSQDRELEGGTIQRLYFTLFIWLVSGLGFRRFLFQFPFSFLLVFDDV